MSKGKDTLFSKGLNAYVEQDFVARLLLREKNSRNPRQQKSMRRQIKINKTSVRDNQET
jgi:hypothetical protein